MQAKVAILARVRKATGGYEFITMDEKKGRFIPVEGAISYLIRYTPASTNGAKMRRKVVPAGRNFPEVLARYTHIERDQSLIRNGMEPEPNAELPKKTGPLTIDEAVSQYLEHINERVTAWRAGAKKGDALSPNSISTYTRSVKDLQTYCREVGVVYMPTTDETGKQEADEINQKMLVNYKWHLYKNLARRKGQQSETIATRFRNISIFLGFHKIQMVQNRNFRDGRGLLMPNEMPRAARPGRNGAPEVIIYSDEQLEALFFVADRETATYRNNLWTGPKRSGHNEQDFLQFLLKLGIRASQATHAEWSDIDWNNSAFEVKDSQDKLEKYDWRPKDHERRVLPIEEKLLARLKARKFRQETQARDEDRNAPSLIFPNSNGDVDLMPVARIHKLMDKTRKAGFPWPADSPDPDHTFRKNYATGLHRNGYDIKSIQHLLGHSDMETTMGYIAGNPTAAASAVSKAFGSYGD